MHDREHDGQRIATNLRPPEIDETEQQEREIAGSHGTGVELNGNGNYYYVEPNGISNISKFSSYYHAEKMTMEAPLFFVSVVMILVVAVKCVRKPAPSHF